MDRRTLYRTAAIAQHLAPACTASTEKEEEPPPASPVRQADRHGREFVIGPNYRPSREYRLRSTGSLQSVSAVPVCIGLLCCLRGG